MDLHRFNLFNIPYNLPIGYGRFIYSPISNADLLVMQHCVNENLAYLDEEELEKAKCVATAHNWKIEVE